MDRKQFKEVTGAEWVDEMHIPEGTAFPSFPPSKVDLQMIPYLLPLYERYLTNPPKLTLKGSGNITLHAEETIQKGSVITEYLGAWEPGVKTASSYRFGPINSRYHRNFGAMVEDGFPNVIPFYLYDVRGLPLRIVLVAAEEISQGDLLTYNYGPKHSVKLQTHTEYRLEEMGAFFRKFPLKSCLERIKAQHGQKRSALGWKGSLELENAIAKVQYLYQTPSAALHLLLERKIATKEFFYFWNKPDYRFYLLGVPYDPSSREREWIEGMQILSLYFQGDRSHDRAILDLLHLRLRIVIQLVIKGVLEEGVLMVEEAHLWDSAFDAIKRQDRMEFERIWLKSIKREELLKAGIAYAKEIGSSLAFDPPPDILCM